MRNIVSIRFRGALSATCGVCSPIVPVSMSVFAAQTNGCTVKQSAPGPLPGNDQPLIPPPSAATFCAASCSPA